MSSENNVPTRQVGDIERVAEYVAEIVAQAPPISSEARARLAAVLGSAADRRAA